MKLRKIYRASAAAVNLTLKIQAGGGSTDWNLLGVYFKRSSAESITITLKAVDNEDAEEYIIAQETAWTGTQLVMTNPVALDRKSEIVLVTSGVTAGTLKAKAVAEIDIS